MSDPRDFRLYVPRVARALGLRLSRTRAPSETRSRIYQALLHAAEVDVLTLRGQIGRAAEVVRPPALRAYHMATLLFGYAWVVGPESPAANELRHQFRRYYADAARESTPLWEFLRDDVRDRGLSSNKLVREMAADVRGEDAAGPDDAAAVGDPLFPPDVRLRAAGRLLEKADAKRLHGVIEYLRELHRAERSKERKRVWVGLYEALKAYGQRPEVATALRDGLVRHAGGGKFFGWLLDLAAEANLAAVPAVAQAARSAAHSDAPTYSRLLKHMTVRYHSDTAAAALRDLVLDPTRPAGAADAFVAAANDLSDLSTPPPALQQLLAAAADTLRGHAGLAVYADAITLALGKWGQELTDQEVTDHLTGRGQLKPARLRKCGRQGFAAITRIAGDTRGPTDDRVRAVQAAAIVRTPFLKKSIIALLWQLFRRDPTERVRVAALHGLAEKDPELTDAERELLHAERTASAQGSELRRAFEDEKVSAWMYLTDLPDDAPTVP